MESSIQKDGWFSQGFWGSPNSIEIFPTKLGIPGIPNKKLDFDSFPHPLKKNCRKFQHQPKKVHTSRQKIELQTNILKTTTSKNVQPWNNKTYPKILGIIFLTTLFSYLKISHLHPSIQVASQHRNCVRSHVSSERRPGEAVCGCCALAEAAIFGGFLGGCLAGSRSFWWIFWGNLWDLRGVGEIDGNLVENDWECLDLGKVITFPIQIFLGWNVSASKLYHQSNFRCSLFTKSEHHFWNLPWIIYYHIPDP